MSSTPISGGGSPIPVIPLNDPGGAPQTMGLQGTPLPPVNTYLSLPFSKSTFETLGIDLPRNPEDVAALLSEVSHALELTVAELRKESDAQKAEERRAAFTVANAFIASMVALNGQYFAFKAERDARIAERDEKTQQKTTNENLSNSLQSQINTKNQEINNLNNTVNSLNSQITSLNSQIAAAQAAGNTALVNSLTAQRDALVIQRDGAVVSLSTATQQRDALVAQKTAVDAVITQLGNDIANLNTLIAAAEANMTAARNNYLIVQSFMFYFFVQATMFFWNLEPILFLSQFQRDDLVARVFEDIAERLREGTIFTIGNLGPLAFLHAFEAVDILQRLAEALGIEFDRDEAANLLEALQRGQIPAPTVLGLVLVAAINSLTIDQLRNADLRGRLIAAAVGLVAGLADVVTVLAALEAVDAIDANEALSDGLRLRLAI
jgi:hypothetical protein